MERDTIAAIATGLVPSGIGIIRVSGPDAIRIVDGIFTGADLSEASTHTIHYGMISLHGELIDEVLVALMRSPRSYTKEDTVEIDCHGSPLVMQKVLEAVCHAGARLAEPGEFTKRAFFNGRMDLSEAESVIDLIYSKTDYARKSALSILRGSMKEKISELRKRLLHRTAYIEAALDDPEHYDLSGFTEELRRDVLQVEDEIDRILQTSENGRLLAEGIRTVILGKPNVGKSSLLNCLLGEDRAIVTEIAGTTRDTLEEQALLDGILLKIIDTAGIQDTMDPVEKIGVKKAVDSLSDADLILFVVDGSKPLTEEDHQIAGLLGPKTVLGLLNKSDLPAVVSKEMMEEQLSLSGIPILSISSKMGQGLDQLKTTISNVFFQGNISFNDELIVTNVRQKESLRKTKESLSRVLESIEAGMPEDFYSVDLMDAYGELGRIIGEKVEEDLVNEIFAEFCMGK
ncbi:MAG: tRNA uridine-5-carboxymethylaminomethyl(34) synthesis GTPase MnmE [Lachnospiraceae bacterium]|nr:tRNA uridine-5-carboxymethylaminomethyl(34) synthesis GTPase MnmE [Lachnospiraceae bacterium]